MKWFLLSSILFIILAGCVLLMIDYDTVAHAIQGVAGAFTCYAAAWMLYRYCNKRNLLPS